MKLLYHHLEKGIVFMRLHFTLPHWSTILLLDVYAPPLFFFSNQNLFHTLPFYLNLPFFFFIDSFLDFLVHFCQNVILRHILTCVLNTYQSLYTVYWIRFRVHCIRKTQRD
jgi:hypothetical protein